MLLSINAFKLSSLRHQENSIKAEIQMGNIKLSLVFCFIKRVLPFKKLNQYSGTV